MTIYLNVVYTLHLLSSMSQSGAAKCVFNASANTSGTKAFSDSVAYINGNERRRHYSNGLCYKTSVNFSACNLFLFLFCFLKPWPDGLVSRCKSTQVCKTRTCVRTCDGWPNGFAIIRLASSGKLQKTVNFTRMQLTCDQLVSTCVGWPNGESMESACARV